MPNGYDPSPAEIAGAEMPGLRQRIEVLERELKTLRHVVEQLERRALLERAK